LSRGDRALARAHSTEALALVEQAWKATPNDALRLLLANSHILAGEVASADGNRDAARMHWQQAEQLLMARAGETLPFERLDSLVRALQHTGRATEARPHQQRLVAAGYIPLKPFPLSTRSAVQRKDPNPVGPPARTTAQAAHP
jgi:hypothetical protein